MRTLIRSLLFILALALPRVASANFTVTGTLQYTRNWMDTGQYNGTGSLIPAAQRTGVFPLADVQVCFQSISFGRFCSGFTGSNGAYSVTVPAPSATYTQVIVFAGQSGIASGAQGYRVVAASGNSAPLEAFIGSSFQGPPSGTVNRGTLTFTPCAPATSTCPNDFANGHQVLQWAAARWRSTFAFPSNVVNFETALQGIKYFTDRTSDGFCGFGGCCNFDFGESDIATCWHEVSHSLLANLITANASGRYGNFPGQGACPGDDSSGFLVDEGLANLNSLLMGYSIASAANLAGFSGFCFSSAQPAGDELNDCSSCEFTPSLTQYPKPAQACGSDPTQHVRRTECRELKLLLDLVDSKTVNGPGCLSEPIAITYGALYNRVATIPDGTGEGQTRETGIGGNAIGTAVSSIDAFSIMDVLKAITPASNPSTANRYRVWANACYMPGEASWATGTFLPAGGQVNPPF